MTMTTTEAVNNQPLPNEIDILDRVHGFSDVYNAAMEMAQIREINKPEGNWLTVGAHDDDAIGVYNEQDGRWSVRDPSYIRGRASSADVERLGGKESWFRARVGQVGTYRKMRTTDGNIRIIAVDDRGSLIAAPATTESETALQAANFQPSQDPDFGGGEFQRGDEYFFPRIHAEFAPEDGVSYHAILQRPDLDANTRGRHWDASVAYWEKAAKRVQHEREQAERLAAAAAEAAERRIPPTELAERPEVARVIWDGAQAAHQLRDTYAAKGRPPDYDMVTIAEDPDALPSVWVIGRVNRGGARADWIVALHPPGWDRKVDERAALRIQCSTTEHLTDIVVSGQPVDVEPLVVAYREKAAKELASSRGSGGMQAAARATESLHMAEALSLIARAAQTSGATPVDKSPESMQAGAELLVEAQAILFESPYAHPQKGAFLEGHAAQ